MNPIIQTLLEIAQREDGSLEQHSSSYWKEHSDRTRIKGQGKELDLKGSGFQVLYPKGFWSGFLNWLHRSSYWSVTERLESFPNVWKQASRLALDLKGGCDFYIFKNVMVLSILMDHWSKTNRIPNTFALIGDGYGFLGALIGRFLPNARLYCIDLPKVLAFQVSTHERSNPDARMAFFSSAEIAKTKNVLFVLPQDIEKIKDAIDCGINIASMQQMTRYSIQAYFTFLRRRSVDGSHFYTVNRERKEMPGGEVTEFDAYPWSPNDEIFLDGECPFMRHFVTAYTGQKGPAFFGLRIPFWNYFSGTIRHRLAHLSPVNAGATVAAPTT